MGKVFLNVYKKDTLWKNTTQVAQGGAEKKQLVAVGWLFIQNFTVSHQSAQESTTFSLSEPVRTEGRVFSLRHSYLEFTEKQMWPNRQQN